MLPGEAQRLLQCFVRDPSYDSRAHEVVKVNDAHELLIRIDNRHRDDSVLLHPVYDCAPELVVESDPGRCRHYGGHRNQHYLVFPLPKSRKVSRCNHPRHPATFVADYRNSPPLGQLDDCFAHRCSQRKYRQEVPGDHYIANLSQELPPQRATRMQTREVLGLETLFLEQRHRQRVADCKGDRSARRWGEIQNARLLLHPGVEHNVGMPAKRGTAIPGNCNGADPEALEMFEQGDELVRFTALGDQDSYIRLADNSEIAMKTFGWMQECRRRSRRCKRRGDLSSDQTGLADSR